MKQSHFLTNPAPLRAIVDSIETRKNPAINGSYECGREDSNLHGINSH